MNTIAALNGERHPVSLDLGETAAGIGRLHGIGEALALATEEGGCGALRMLQAIADAAPDLVFVKDREGRYLFLNAAAAKVKGAPVAEVLGKDDRSFFDADFAARLMSTDREIMASGVAREVEESPIVDGERRVFLSLKAPYRDDAGAVVGIIGISRDITDAQRSAAQLARAEARWQVAVDCSGDGIWDWDLRSGEVFYSSGWKSMLGHSDDEIGDGPLEWQDRVHPADLPNALAGLRRHLAGDTADYDNDHRMRTRSGEWLWARCRARVIERDAAGEALRIVGILVDISAEVAERQRAEQVAHELALLAEIDELTEVANRRGFNRALTSVWQNAPAAGVPVHLALIDVDRFKSYNDGHGHGAGDEALCALASVVAGLATGEGDIAARYGGDEFALLLTGDVDLAAVLDTVRREMSARGLTHGDGTVLTVSCGGSSGSTASVTAGRLLREADRRLYEAKATGRNRVIAD